MRFRLKDLLGIADLAPEEIQLILDTAVSFKEVSTREIKKVPTLRGKTVVTLFYEPSTRTRTSFEIAAKRLSADTVNLTIGASSVVKGETLADTADNLEAMRPDIIIIRHSASGAPHFLAKRLKSSIINAGDGLHEHPTQALLDLLTVREAKGRLDGLKIAIIGDIAHSRVARSNIQAFTKMGSQVTVCGPVTMLPPYLEELGVEVSHSLPAAVRGADVVMMLRLQLERQEQMYLSTLREYARFFGLSMQHLELAQKDALVMHPGPLNRGVEIAPEVADSAQSVILEQVTNGVAVRMAILYLLTGGEPSGTGN
ncbi:MAG: aspartate carbamoyltransferase catalytic subunit [Deltaproteobacteria bacterium]|nr:aspartate carbamoyltransferase catalytic subunit [Deltaproteobacteria bacterium]MBW1952268.1 aspartate carbamoyltransferase catalytic subunit [Deltaproteobacteria bacterium]MBW1987066.1 aspartate carbamoyltransferase catalytic subunit [Deltaproteobacteria bacterium]MBW2133975.1 aspartate carbamoyltransferase catalytic subunit [Deltaproteobacteria bacterium]